MRTWKGLLVFLALVIAAGAVGSLFPPDAWFAALRKPSFNPPAWLFAPVWTLLYVLMAVAAWRVCRVDGVRAAIALWLLQLACNTAWSPLFFGAHRIDLALADIGVLLVLIVATLAAFWRRERLAAALLLPYLAWVGFATALNVAFWQLNR